MPPGRSARAAILSVLVALLLSGGASATSFRPVALSGAPAPGTAPGVTLVGDFTSAIDASGRVVYLGAMFGPGVDDSVNDRGLWLDGPGGTQLLARTGDAAPGMPEGVRFTDVGSPLFNRAGALLFLGVVSGGGASPAGEQGYWTTDGHSAPRLLYRTSDPLGGAGVGVGVSYVPGAGSVSWSRGGLAFSSQLVGTGVTLSNSRAVLAPDAAGGLSVVAREGSQPPGTVTGVSFYPWNASPVISERGAVAFNSELRGTGVNSANNAGIWRQDPGGALQLVVRTGDALTVSGLSSPVVLRELSAPRFADDGSIYFRATADASYGGAGVYYEYAIWRADPAGRISLVLPSGIAAPGFGAGVVLKDLDPVATDADTFVLKARLYHRDGGGISFDNDDSYWLLRGGSLQLLAREGDIVADAIGTPTFHFDLSAPNPDTNARGDLLFRAQLRGPSVGLSNDEAIFFASSDQGLEMVVRTGDEIELAPGDRRVVSSVSEGISRYQSPLSDGREILMWLQFTDGSSALVAASVPEPGTGALVLMGLIALATARLSGRA